MSSNQTCDGRDEDGTGSPLETTAAYAVEGSPEPDDSRPLFPVR